MILCNDCKIKITGRGKSLLCRRCVKKSKNLPEKIRFKMSSAAKKRTGIKSSNYGKKFSPEHCKKISNALAGKKISIHTRTKMSIAKQNMSFVTREKLSAAKKGKSLSNEHRTSISNSMKGKISPMFGKHHSAESKRKIRLFQIKTIEKNKFDGNQMIPRWSPAACQKIDEYGKQNRYNFQHAMNGGEHYIEKLGYWVDGYDKEKNVVIEYYEKKHNNQVQKDLQRETEICNHLGCDFIILWENNYA